MRPRCLHQGSSQARPRGKSCCKLRPMQLLVALASLCARSSALAASDPEPGAIEATPAAVAVSVLLVPTIAPQLQVPHSFLGLSHEPLTMAKHALPTPQYRNFIKLLSSFETGPFIIRWGGNEQDKLFEPLDDEQWAAMRDLHALTGTRYMIGLNLKAKDPALAATQVSNAMRFLPPESVLAFNIGNEADAFTYRESKALFPADYWSNGWFDDVTRYCEALEPILLKYFNHTKLIAGPGSADMTQWRDTQAKRFGGKAPLNAFASMLTTHYYTYRSTSPGASHTTFLAESKLDLVHRRVGPWVRWAHAQRMHFRLEETNTLAISGLAGASDTLAASLFYVDYAMTMLKAGVSGMNFHDSACSAYSAIVFPWVCEPEQAARGSCADTCGKSDTVPLLRAPYYGMLFIQMALSKLPKILQGIEVTKERGAPNVKVHALHTADGELRVVMVKKDGAQPAQVGIRIQGAYRDGSLTLMEAPTLTSFVEDITLAGQQVSDMGELHGEREVAAVPVDAATHDGWSEYTVTLPAASAGLLIVRPTQARTAQR